MEQQVETNKQKQEQYLAVTPQNKKIGLFFLISALYAIPILESIFVFWKIFTTFKRVGDLSSLLLNIRTFSTPALIIQIFCLFLGMIIFLQKKPVKELKFDERSGKGTKSEIPAEIAEKKWHWGAAFLRFAWGPYNNVWISLLFFIPFFWIVLGVKGYKWAWQKSKWESVDSFLETQRKWETAGIAYFGLIMTLIVIGILSMTSLVNGMQNNSDNSNSADSGNQPIHSVQSSTSGQGNLDWAKIK